MGPALAKNTLDDTITQALDILNQTTQNCETSLAQNQNINISNCTNVTLKNIDFNQSGSIDIKCAEAASASSDIQSEISQQFSQAAAAINQALSLNPSSTTAENITKLMEELSTQIQNVYTNNCIPSTIQSQGTNITCPTQGGTVDLEFINFVQTNQAIIDCTQQTIANSAIKNQLDNIIDQTAKATVEPLLSFGAIILVVVIVIIFLIYNFTPSGNTILIIFVILTVVTIIYLIVAYIYKFYPFQVQSQ